MATFSSVPPSKMQRRLRAPWGWACAGLVLGVIVVTLLAAPAQWVVRGVNAFSQGRVVLSDGAGTVWAGSAHVALSGGAGSQGAMRLPGRVAWTLGLGLGRLNVGLSASCCMMVPMQLAFAPLSWLSLSSGWTVEVQAHQSRWPAAVLAGLGTPWNTVQVEGNLAISTPGFAVQMALDRMALTGDIALEALDMRSRLSTLQALGSYRMQLTGGEQPALALSTLKGDLQLSGQGRWNAGRLRFEGEARAEPAHAQELSNLLNIMGRRDGVRSIIILG